MNFAFKAKISAKTRIIININITEQVKNLITFAAIPIGIGIVLTEFQKLTGAIKSLLKKVRPAIILNVYKTTQL